MLRQDFDGNIAPQARITRAIHLAHAARTQERLNFIRPEFRASSEGHACVQL